MGEPGAPSDWPECLRAIAERADGTPIRAALGIGGFSEINVVMEEYTCPVFTDLPAAQLALRARTVNAVRLQPEGRYVCFKFVQALFLSHRITASHAYNH